MSRHTDDMLTSFQIVITHIFSLHRSIGLLHIFLSYHYELKVILKFALYYECILSDFIPETFLHSHKNGEISHKTELSMNLNSDIKICLNMIHPRHHFTH